MLLPFCNLTHKPDVINDTYNCSHVVVILNGAKILISGGKLDSWTGGRPSSQRCKEEANGNWIIDTVGQTGTIQARLRDYPVL